MEKAKKEKAEKKTEVELESKPVEEKGNPWKEKREKKEGQGFRVPAYLAFLLLILGIVAGMAVYSVLFPCQPVYIDDCGSQNGGDDVNGDFGQKVDIKVLTSGLFQAIDGEQNTVFLLLDQKGVKYDRKTYNVDNPEGANLKRNYNVEMVPTVLINADDLKSYASGNQDLLLMVQAFENSYLLVNDYYVVPEDNLDLKAHPKVWLDSPIADCQARQDGVSSVHLFEDPYSLNALTTSVFLKDLRKNYEGSADYTFVYNSSQYGRESFDQEELVQAELAAKYLHAAQAQGKFFEFQDCFINTYCDKDGSGKAEDAEIFECYKGNSHYKNPLSTEELDACVASVGLDEEAVNNFLAGEASLRLESDLELSAAFAVNDLNVVMATVECTVNDVVFNVDDILCKMRPDIPICVEFASR